MSLTPENNAFIKGMIILCLTRSTESLTTRGNSPIEISSLPANAVIGNTNRLNLRDSRHHAVVLRFRDTINKAER